MSHKNNIRNLRNSKGMTVLELSNLINVCTNTIYSWERGDTEPKSSQICALAEVFECDAETIMSLRD